MAFKLIIFLFVFLNSLAYSQEPQNLISAKEAIEIIKEEEGTFHFVNITEEEFLATCGDVSFNKDQNLMHQYCTALVESDVCKNVSPMRRKNCDKDLISSFSDSPSLIWNCLKGVGLGVADIFIVIGKILKGLYNLISSPIDTTKKIGGAGGDILGQFQNYASTAYLRELNMINKENPPPNSKSNKMMAAQAVAGMLFSNLGSQVLAFLHEKNADFSCLNNANQSKEACHLATNIVSLFFGGKIAINTVRWFLPLTKGRIAKLFRKNKKSLAKIEDAQINAKTISTIEESLPAAGGLKAVADKAAKIAWKDYAKLTASLAVKFGVTQKRFNELLKKAPPTNVKLSRKTKKHIDALHGYARADEGVKIATNNARQAIKNADKAAQNAQRLTAKAKTSPTPLSKAEADLAVAQSNLAQRNATLAASELTFAEAQLKVAQLEAAAIIAPSAARARVLNRQNIKNKEKVGQFRKDVDANQSKVNTAANEVKRYEEVPVIRKNRAEQKAIRDDANLRGKLGIEPAPKAPRNPASGTGTSTKSGSSGTGTKSGSASKSKLDEDLVDNNPLTNPLAPAGAISPIHHPLSITGKIGDKVRGTADDVLDDIGKAADDALDDIGGGRGGGALDD